MLRGPILVLSILIFLFLLIPSLPVQGQIFTDDPMIQEDELRLSLEEVLLRATSISPDLRIQDLQMAMTQEQFVLDIRKFFPQLSISYSGNDTVTIGSTDNYTRQITFKLSQPIFDGGVAMTQRRLAGLQLLLQQQQTDNATYQLEEQVWQLYYQLGILLEQQIIQRANFEQVKEQTRILELELQQGSVTPLEFLEAEIQIKNQEIALAQTERSIAQSRYELNEILQYDINTPIRPQEDTLSDYEGMTIPFDAQQIYALALENNIEVESQLLAITQSKEQYRLSQQRYMPTISLDASYSLVGNPFPLQGGTLQLTFNLSFNSLDSPITSSISGGSTSGEGANRGLTASITPLQQLGGYITERQALLAVQEAELNWERQERSLLFNIQVVLEEYEELKYQITLLREALDLEKRRMDIMERQVELGELRRSELVSAGSELEEKQLALLQEILKLVQMERNIEGLAGLSPGAMETYSYLIEELQGNEINENP